MADSDQTQQKQELHRPRVYPRGQGADRDAMIARHLGLARHLALRYSDGAESLEDLVQVASLGLVKAVDRFDPARGVAFSTFAVPTILGELRRHFRDRGWAVHVPRDLKEASLRVSRALADHPGRAPKPVELADQTGLSLELVLEALEALGAQRAISLDAPVDGEEDAGATMLDLLGGDDDELERAHDRATLKKIGHVLRPREREILRLRFEEDLTQSEIGQRVGISQMQVSRVIRDALVRLRDAAGP